MTLKLEFSFVDKILVIEKITLYYCSHVNFILYLDYCFLMAKTMALYFTEEMDVGTEKVIQ